MDLKIITSYLLLICLIVNIEICASFVEERTFSTAIPTLPTDDKTNVFEQKFDGSASKVSKRYRREDEDDADVDGAPPDHVIPRTSHEDPEEPSTKPKYTKPGAWAKPPEDRDIGLDFVPTKLYAQVRGTHTVKRVPREEAIETAETAEEILSAPRLREVVSKSKKNTVYTEEGYEDSAYDHAGHVRDADFHEGFARKLDDERRSKEGISNEPMGDENEDLRNNERSGNDEESDEYDDDYREHAEESSRVEDTKPQKRKTMTSAEKDKYKSIKNLLHNSDVDPKHVVENEIVRLEGDLNEEYAESEKNADNQVPDNLKNSGTEYVDEDEPEKREDENSDKPEETRIIVNESNGERDKLKNKKLPVVSTTKSANVTESSSTLKNPTEFHEIASASPSEFVARENARESQNFADLSSLTTPNYGQIFWNYFKLAGNDWNPNELSTPMYVSTTVSQSGKSIPIELTSPQNFASAQPTVRAFDGFTFNHPSTELSDFISASSSVDPAYHSPAEFYESWKRSDRKLTSDDNSIQATNDSENSNTTSKNFLRESKIGVTNYTNDDDDTITSTPKKLPYLVIVRSNNKTTTTSSPCDKDERKLLERPKLMKSLTSPRTTKMTNSKGGTRSRVINDPGTRYRDFTVMQPPLPVPLGQVTYADFLSDTYDSPIRQTVTQESGRVVKKLNVERGRYNESDSPYDKRFSNVFGHASKGPHFHPRHGHLSPAVQKSNLRHRQLPSTMLLPPLPIVGTSYADYSEQKRLENPINRFNRSPRSEPWSDLVRFYRSIDERVFGKRKRRSIGTARKIEESRRANETSKFRSIDSSNDRVKVDRDFVASVEKNRRPRRNFLLDGANRLVATNVADTASDDNFSGDKSNWTRSRRDHDDLLNESPRIAEKEINAEIESRFNGEEDDSEEEKSDDSTENERGNIDVQVPDFDVHEIIENDKNNGKILGQPIEAKKLNVAKYPFYENSRVPQNSALKYVMNPRDVPRKTLGGTEFYDSRDIYLECEDPEPNLEGVTPDNEEPMSDREQSGNKPRLRGLGDKLDCFRAKYFDENPLDNPLFLEKQIDQPRPPEEFNSNRFASRIFAIPSADQQERQVIRRISRKPEINDVEKSGSRRNQITREAERNSRLTSNGNSRRTRDRTNENRQSQRKVEETREQKKKPEKSSIEPAQRHQVTPYQRQVYEDVMGTIKKLAGMYEAFGDAAPTSSSQSNVNYFPSDVRQRDGNFSIVRIADRPRNFMIQGLTPPQVTASASELQPVRSYRIIPHRPNRVSYKTRLRTEGPPGGRNNKVGYFRTVRVHKRSVDDSQIIENHDMNVGETRNLANRGKNNSTTRPSVRKRTTSGDNESHQSRGRIRFSRPREDFGKNGKFSNLEAAGTEDVRRKEPRYNRIQRKKTSPSESTERSTSTAVKYINEQNKTADRHDFHNEPDEIYKIQLSMARGVKAAPSVIQRRSDEDLTDDDEEEDEEGEGPKRTGKYRTGKNDYDVHEEIDGDITTVSNLNVDPTRAPEFYRLGDYLESEPPGYSKAFSESSTEDVPHYKGNRNNQDKQEEEDKEVEVDYDDEERLPKSNSTPDTKENHEEQQEDDPEEQEKYEQLERPSESYTNEETSSKSDETEDEPDPETKFESHRNSKVDDEETKEDESIHDGEKEFHRFASRPFSPFESYEDPKYSELGPRLSKPAFYHPSFKKPTSSKRRRGEYFDDSDDDDDDGGDGGGSDEKGSEKISRYKFPWEDDETEAAEESKNKGRTLEGYEYPWVKRERLAEERRKKEKARRDYEKLFEFSDDSDDNEKVDDEQNASNTELHGKRIYPWDYYDVPSKNLHRNNIRRSDRIIDNVEVGTSYRPIMKFSSRYKSRLFDPNNDDDPVVVSVADPKEIRQSVIKSIDEAIKTTTIVPVEEIKKFETINSTTEATTTTGNSRRTVGEASTTVGPRRKRKWMTSSTATSSTVPSTTTNRSTRENSKLRNWRITSTTTKKPIRSRKRTNTHVADDLPKSGSHRIEITTQNSIGGRFNSSKVGPFETTSTSVVNRKIRRRGQFVNRPVNSTITVTSKPVRRRLTKLTATTEPSEEPSSEITTESITTPKSKTVEHRSRFTKEEIITKTLYPKLNSDDNDEREHDGSNENTSDIVRNGERSKKSKKLMNESVKKVSIVTQETPDHIYRTEATDKDGVKGMFVSITPNNGTTESFDSMDRPEDRTIDDDETDKMFDSFNDFDDMEYKQDDEILFRQDSHLMANLLKQVPPFVNDFAFDRGPQRGNDFSDIEGSGDEENDEKDGGRRESTFNYEKDPNKRLYYYVEK